jgi:hypothetical protein
MKAHLRDVPDIKPAEGSILGIEHIYFVGLKHRSAKAIEAYREDCINAMVTGEPIKPLKTRYLDQIELSHEIQELADKYKPSGKERF